MEIDAIAVLDALEGGSRTVLAAKCTTCGHVEADHKSNRGLDRAFGVCLVEGVPVPGVHVGAAGP